MYSSIVLLLLVALVKIQNSIYTFVCWSFFGSHFKCNTLICKYGIIDITQKLDICWTLLSTILKGMACYEGQLLAPAEGIRLMLFCLSRKKCIVYEVLVLFQPFLLCSVVTIVTLNFCYKKSNTNILNPKSRRKKYLKF